MPKVIESVAVEGKDLEHLRELTKLVLGDFGPLIAKLRDLNLTFYQCKYGDVDIYIVDKNPEGNIETILKRAGHVG